MWPRARTVSYTHLREGKGHTAYTIVESDERLPEGVDQLLLANPNINDVMAVSYTHLFRAMCTKNWAGYCYKVGSDCDNLQTRRDSIKMNM